MVGGRQIWQGLGWLELQEEGRVECKRQEEGRRSRSAAAAKPEAATTRPTTTTDSSDIQVFDKLLRFGKLSTAAPFHIL